MPRILKRPMFSRGGSTNKNNGIMTGLVDRKELNKGTPSPFTEERTSADVKAMMDAMNEYAPVTKQRLNLGKVGLNLASGKYSGGDLISSLAGAGSDIYDDYTTKDDAYRAALAKRKQAAVTSSLGQQLKEANTIPKIPTTKIARNISNETIYGVPPGGTAFLTNQQLIAAQGKFDKPPSGGFDIQFNDDGTMKSLTQGDGNKNNKTEQEARKLKVKTFQMNNAGQNLISNLRDAKTGPTGAFIQALDSAGAQIKQAANLIGFNTTKGKNQTFDDTGSGDIDRYIQDKFGSEIGNDSVKFAKIRSVSINLAYLMANADESGGRFTDKDIALKMEEMGLGADPARTIEVLTNSLQIRNSNAAYEYKQLTNGGTLDFSDINVVGSIPGAKDKKDKTNQRNMDKVFNPLGVPEDQLTPIK